MSDTLQVTAEKRPTGQINVVSEPFLPASISPGQNITVIRGEYESWQSFTGTSLVLLLNGVDVTSDIGVDDDYTVPLSAPADSTLEVTETPTVTGGFSISRTITRNFSSPLLELQTDLMAEDALDLFASYIRAGVTVFQDEAGEVDVIQPGDPVRLVTNIYAGGPDATIEDTNKPAIYHSDGVEEWLEFPDGAKLSIPFNMAQKEWEHLIAYEPKSRNFTLASTGYPFYGLASQGSASNLDPANVFTKEIVYDGIGFPVTTRGDFYEQSQQASVLYYRAANNAANAWDPLLIGSSQTPGPMYALLIRGADNLFDSADRLPTALQENAISWAAQFVGSPDPYAPGDIEIQED